MGFKVLTTAGAIKEGSTPSVDLATATGTLTVSHGGTGRTSDTAYAVICGGTTTTDAQQSIAGVGSAGEVLTSNGAGALPTFQAASSASTIVVVKASADTATTDAALSDDSELFFTVGAGETWVVDMWLIYDAGTTGDIQWGWTLPSGSGIHGGLRNPTANTTTPNTLHFNGTTIGSAVNAGGLGAAVVAIAKIYASFVVGGSGGTVHWQFAQNTSNGTTTTVQAGSFLVAMKKT
jgi:hypothetical protein